MCTKLAPSTLFTEIIDEHTTVNGVRINNSDKPEFLKGHCKVTAKTGHVKLVFKHRFTPEIFMRPLSMFPRKRIQ